MFRRQTYRPSVNRRTVLMEAVEPRQHMDADNTIGGAVSLGSVATYVSKSGGINKSSDASDFYKFTVPGGNKDFKLKLSGLTNNADLYLYNSSKTQISSSKVSGTASESITKTALSAGTYYAEVRAVTSSSNYTLKLATDFVGDSKTAAKDLGTFDGSITYGEYVGSLDTGDYYKFKMTKGFTPTIKIDGLSADANLELLDSGGNSLAKSSKTGTSSDSIVKALAPGTYYAKVVPASSSVDAKYTLTLVPPTTPAGPGDSMSTAENLGTLGGTKKTVTGNVHGYSADGKTNHWYKFTTSGNGALEIDLTGLSADADIRLYDPNYNLLAQSLRNGTTAEHITYGAKSGTYYVMVSNYLGNSADYTLSAVKNPISDIDYGGEGLDGPAILTQAPNGTASKTGLILNNGFNTEDAYLFDATDPSPIYVFVSGMSAKLDVGLYDEDHNFVAAATYGTGTATIAYTPTKAGSYIVLIGSTDDEPIAATASHYKVEITGKLDTGGNTVAAAPLVSTPYTVSGKVGSFDESDVYKVNVPSNSYLIMNISTADNFVAMQFLDANGTVVDTVAASKGHDNDMTYFLHAGGVRYVRVINSNSYVSNYTLSVKTQAF